MCAHVHGFCVCCEPANFWFTSLFRCVSCHIQQWVTWTVAPLPFSNCVRCDSLCLPVIPLMEVYNKSLCQPRELLVEILQEYPDEVEHIFIPSCVVLTRCAGCCSDEMLQCTPTSTYNVTMEVSICTSNTWDQAVFFIYFFCMYPKWQLKAFFTKEVHRLCKYLSDQPRVQLELSMKTLSACPSARSSKAA